MADTQSDDSASEDETHPPNKARTKGKKSGRLRTAEHKTRVEVDWPHYYVYRDGKAAAYNDLTIAEFSYGHSCKTDNAPPSCQPWLRSHFKDIMEDAMLYKWQVVRNYHGIILNMVETGRLGPDMSASDLTNIQDLRRQHVWNKPGAQLPRHNDRPSHAPLSTSTINASIATCSAYQHRSCDHLDSHDSLEHACSYCLKVTGRPLPHPEAVCRRKREHWAKNGKQEAPQASY